MNTKIKIFVVLGLMALSLAVVAGSAYAKGSNTGVRGGWGWGDTENHEHTGPAGGPSVFPGPSVHPGGNGDDHDEGHESQQGDLHENPDHAE